MIPQGYLRSGVDVELGEDTVTLAAGLNYIELPRKLIDRHPSLAAFLRREVPRDALQEPELANAVSVLEQHKCLHAAREQDTYTAAELKEWFSPVADDWYRRYYLHPVWKKLRTRELSKTGVTTWVIHNYHISRAAGISDSRCASARADRALYETFANNALEEYWHCDAFYFVRHQELSVSDSSVKNYVPTSSSLGFEQLTYQLAEGNWVAHSLVTLFQESSIKFYDDASVFYATVEGQYGLDGFFKSWVRHMDLDRTHGHVDMVGNVLSESTRLTRVQAREALGLARCAFEFLIQALDDILVSDGRGEPTLRLPIEGGVLDPSQNALVRDAGIKERRVITNATPDTLPALLVGMGLPVFASGTREVAGRDKDYLWREVNRSLFRAAGRARAHDEVVVFGHLARASFSNGARVRGTLNAPLPASVWAVALANLFHEVSVRPLEHAFLCSFCCEMVAAAPLPGDPWLPIDKAGAKWLSKLLVGDWAGELNIDRLATLALQASELFSRWVSDAGMDVGLDFGFRAVLGGEGTGGAES